MTHVKVQRRPALRGPRSALRGLPLGHKAVDRINVSLPSPQAFPQVRVRKRATASRLLARTMLLAGLLSGCASLEKHVDLARRVDALIAPLVTANEFSGAVVLARGGEVVYQRGFGMANHASETPFTPDTATDGGSLAKTFTAAGIWWLVLDGQIDPDAPVSRYVAEFPHPQTTVRQLLSHSNGLPPYYEFFDPHFAPDEVRTTEALLRFVAREVGAPSFPPGSRFEYSNLGFDIGALIIERVTGKTYEDFLEERFFSRLAMSDSFARPARLADWQGVRTMGYRWKGEDWEVVDVFDMEGFLGASNLYFSATDLTRWGNANAAGTAIPADASELGHQPELIDGMRSPITALSWYRDSAGARCYYTGSLNAFHSFVYWDRSRNETAVLVSNSSLPPWKTISLQRGLVHALAGSPENAESASEFQVLNKRTRGTVAGRYRAAGLGTVTVRGDADGVSIRVDDGLAFDAFPVSADVLYVPGLDYWLAFGTGQPPADLHVRSMFLDVVAWRVPEPTDPDHEASSGSSGAEARSSSVVGGGCPAKQPTSGGQVETD